VSLIDDIAAFRDGISQYYAHCKKLWNKAAYDELPPGWKDGRTRKNASASS
jgi:hypothetical protein